MFAILSFLKSCFFKKTNPVKRIGYFASISSMGDFSHKFSGYVNFMDIFVDAIESIHALTLKRKRNIIITGLRGDSSDFNKYCEKYIDPHLDSIIGFYPVDEPYLNSISYDQQEAIIKPIKNRYPGKEIWVSYAYMSIPYRSAPVVGEGSSRFAHPFKISPLYDRIGITPHYNKHVANDLKNYYQFLKLHLHPHQKFIVLGDGFTWGAEPTIFLQRAKAAQIRYWYNLAKDVGADTFWIFLWPSMDIGSGVQDMPILENEIMAIAKEIKK